mmetsp:Transcript_680/g.1440  ORF Transcript_680/g.1440 Transcript_680/m.1440 type:complete len:761 (+) Transcript_680:107-2389(+)|eukprot:CAMPEP_0197552022 /NCGR_PEP_ID=MMETSP1320-20131121/5690_1 /TAXON_ID=91990 /ORGANISM="Bolidomonas sp., Strain RCC2347" /LENGTH=760 /DNA_ID=CAMNT_0043112587 /DNA_START=97 /DNA_END=2379 /DNA_ORIENTATION=+
MKFSGLSLLLAMGSGLLAPTSAGGANVIREHVSHFCDFSDVQHATGVTCEARRRRRLDEGAPLVEELADSLAAFSSSSVKIPIMDFDASALEGDEADHWTTVVNFGGELLENLADEYHGLIEVTVEHDEGSTTKTVDVSTITNGVEGVAMGNFMFNSNKPKITLKRVGDEASDKPIPFSHVSHRKLRALATSATTGGCREPVGNQGSCGDCYAWAAVGIANEREGRCGDSGNSVRHLACKAPDIFGRNGGCEGGWVSQSINYMRSDGLCTKNDIPWVWYCWYDDCLVCDGNWFTTDAKDPSCNRNKLDGTGNWRSMYITTTSATAATALKNYLTQEGTFGYSFAVRSDFKKYGSESQCYNGDPYIGGSNSCCRKKINCGKGKKCSASDCEQDSGGHAVRIVGYGTKNGEEYWNMQNSWGTGWADGGYAKLSIYNSNWAWSHVTVDSKLWRRMLAADPDYGADYLGNEEEYHPRFLNDDELPDEEQPGTDIDFPTADVITDIGETAMRNFNCSIVPVNSDAFSEDHRADSTNCISKIALELIDEVVVSKKLLNWIMQFSAGFAGHGSKNHAEYKELADEMADDIFSAVNTTSMETAQLKFLTQYLSPLGMTAASIKETKVQAVNGYIWKLKVESYFSHLGSGPDNFVVSLDGWVSGDYSTAKFNLKLDGESGFLDNDESEEGAVTGIHKARGAVEEDLDERKQGGADDAKGTTVLAAAAAAVGVAGVALGFFVRHKIAESRVKQLQSQLSVAMERTEKPML